jgi:hypothetical protein
MVYLDQWFFVVNQHGTLRFLTSLGRLFAERHNVAHAQYGIEGVFGVSGLEISCFEQNFCELSRMFNAGGW